MSEETALRHGLAALSQFFVGGSTMNQTLRQVCDMVVAALPNTDYAAITMLRPDGQPHTGVFTDGEILEVDEAQYRSGSGPCLDAYRTRKPQWIDAMSHESRWPEFRASCVAHGIWSTLSFPLVVDDVSHGALNLYAQQEHAFGAHERDVAALFSAQAAVVLANAVAYWDARELSEQLGRALSSRAVIEQAKGIIMGSTRCSADEAFQTLVKQSQHENRKLRDVAAAIVEQATRRISH